MKKVKLSSFMLGESSMLSANEKKVVMGGLVDNCPDMGQRCKCEDGSLVMPLDLCTFTCPPDCPYHEWI